MQAQQVVPYVPKDLEQELVLILILGTVVLQVRAQQIYLMFGMTAPQEQKESIFT